MTNGNLVYDSVRETERVLYLKTKGRKCFRNEALNQSVEFSQVNEIGRVLKLQGLYSY